MNPSEFQTIREYGLACWPKLRVSVKQLQACAEESAWQCNTPVSQSIAEDLYLVCACALAMEPAVRIFDARFQGDVARALAHMALPPSLAEEVRQSIRTKLFVAREDGSTQVQKYSGRGALGAWLRAVAVRTAIDVLRREKSDEVPVDGLVLESLAEADVDLDLRVIKDQHRDLVKQAFESGFAQLTARQRNLLRQHYIHSLNIEQLGTMYKVHRATAFRWVAKARADIFDSARQHVAHQLQEEEDDAEELIRLLQSQVDVSLHRLLNTQK